MGARYRKADANGSSGDTGSSDTIALPVDGYVGYGETDSLPTIPSPPATDAAPDGGTK